MGQVIGYSNHWMVPQILNTFFLCLNVTHTQQYDSMFMMTIEISFIFFTIQLGESNPVIPTSSGRCMPTPTQSPLSEQDAGDAIGP